MENNKVVMSLEDYTKIVLENAELKRTLSEYKRKIVCEVEEKINDSLIYRLDKTQTIELLEEKDQRRVFSRVGLYSWSLDSIARNNYFISTKEEVEKLAFEQIKKIANAHLNEILDKEEECEE